MIREIQKKQKNEIPIAEIEIFPNIVFSVEEDLILTEEKSHREELVKQGMKELSLKQREILYYKFTCGFDYKQISEIMAITNDSARQLVSRAIQSIKKYLSENHSILLFITKRIIKN